MAMPINTNNPYGMDLGPAPLDYAAAKANAAKQGMTLTDDELNNVAGINQPTGATTNAQPVSSAQTTMPLSAAVGGGQNLPSGGEGDIFNTPYFRSMGYQGQGPKTAQDVVAGFVATGMPLGAAMNQYKSMKEKGLIQPLPGDAEVESNIPDSLTTFGRMFGISAERPITYGLSWMPGQVGKDAGKMNDQLDREEEALPPGWSKVAGNVVGYTLDAELMGPLADAAAGQIAPRLPFLAKGVQSATDALDAGVASSGTINDVVPAVARLKKWQEGIKLGLQFGGTDVARGRNPAFSLAFPFGIAGFRWAKEYAGFGGSAASQALKGTSALNDAYEFLAGKAGVTADQVKSQVGDVDGMLEALSTTNAPDHVMQSIYNAGTAGEFGDLWSKHVGRFAALKRMNPDELNSFITGARGTKFADQTLQAYDDALSGLRGESENIKPGALPVKTMSVVDQPVERGGVDVYFPPLSKWAQTTNALSEDMVGVGSRVITKDFENPLTVVFKDGEHPAEAMFAQQTGKLANEVTYLANRAAGAYSTDTKTYNNILYNLAAKMASNGGYKSIHFMGPSPASDFVADLSKFDPKAPLSELSSIIEGRINNAANVVYNGIPSYWLPLIGGSAIMGAAAMPQQSQAAPVNFEALKEIIGGLGEDASATPLMNELSRRGDRTAIMALSHVMEYNPLFKAQDVVNKLQETTDAIKANPNAKLDVETDIGPRNILNENKRSISARIMHPDVEMPIASINGSIAEDGVFDPYMISGVAPTLLGPGQARGILRQISQNLKQAGAPEISTVYDEGRLTGVAERRGGTRTVSVAYRGLAPLLIGTGLGSMAGQDKANAALLPPEEVGKLLEGGLDAAANKSTVQVLRMLQAKAPQAGAEELTSTYKNLLGDLNTGDNLKVSGVGDYAGTYSITHPALEPMPIATMHGPIDPDTGTWYADLQGAKDFGFGQKALQQIFTQIKQQSPEIVKLKGPKFSGLLGLAAAAYGVYDMFAPAKAQASEIPPVVEMFEEGIKGAGDDFLNQAASGKSAEDFIRITQEQNEASKNINAQASFDTEGEKAFANMEQSGPTDPGAKAAVGMMQSGSGLKMLPSFRPFHDITDNPLAQTFIGRFTRLRDSMITAKNSTTNRLFDLLDGPITEGNGVDLSEPFSEDSVNFRRALEGLRMNPQGQILQTEQDLPANITKAATEFKQWITDPGFELVKGVRVQAHPIAAQFGLDDTPETWNKLKFLQTKYDPMDTVGGNNRFPDGTIPKASEIEAAKQTQGMLFFNDRHSLDVKYGEGNFSFQPISNQRAVLTDHLNQLTQLYPDGLPPDKAQTAAIIQKYIGDLDQLQQSGAVSRLPMRDVLASKQYFAPLAGKQVPAEVQDLINEPDVMKVGQNYISGIMNKLFWDDQLFMGKKVAQMFQHGFPAMGGSQVIDKDPYLADQIIERLNLYRGMRALRENASITNMINSMGQIAGKDFGLTPSHIGTGAREAINWQYITKLGGIRFPIVASTHVALTTMAAVGLKNTARGFAAYLNDFEGATKEADEAMVTGKRSLFGSELGNNGLTQSTASRVARFADWLPNFVQNNNRVVAFQAGKSWAAEQLANTGKFEVPGWLKFMDESVLDGKHSAADITNAAAAAVVRTTQFVFSDEGKAAMFVGGSARRMIGQFKTFVTNYGVFLNNLFWHGKQSGDWVPFGRAIGSLMTIGGGTSVAGLAVPWTAWTGTNLYDLARTELIKHGIVLPKGSLIGSVMHWALMGNGLVDNKSAIGQALNAVQVSGHLDPFNLPSDPARVPSYLLGPTLGGVYDIGQAAKRVMLGQSQPVEIGRVAANAVLGPLSGTIPEAMQEAGLMGKFFDSIGYRGGSYSPTGRALAGQPGPISFISRGLNLQPSIRSQRYDYVNDLKAAMAGGQAGAASQILDEAQKSGFIIDKREIGAIKAQIKTTQRRNIAPNAPLQ